MTIVVTVLLSLIVGAVAALAIKKIWNSKPESAIEEVEVEVPMEEEVKEKVQNMSNEEREALLQKYEKGERIIRFAKDITCRTRNMKVDFIFVYGTRYTSIKEALKAKNIPNEVRYNMMLTDMQLSVLRKETILPVAHYTVEKSVFCGDVYIYNNCTIGIEPGDEPARIAVKIQRDEHGYAYLTEVYVAASDITTATNYTTFNMATQEDDFNRLIKSNSNYKDEVAEIESIQKRLDKYNYLLSEDLLVQKDNKFVFNPPTDEQLTNLKALDELVNETVETTEETTGPSPFADMHSSKE